MKFTSEDLLKAMGLKVGQTVCVDNTMNFLIYEKGDIYFENLRSHSVISIDKFVEYILNFDYYIIRPKLTLTEDEKIILRNLPKEYKYVTRDSYGKGGNLVLCKESPERNWVLIGGDGYWLENRKQFPCSTLRVFNHLFQFIKWEDEPYSIEELLKEEDNA